MPQRDRSPGAWKRIRSPGVTKELKLRLRNADAATANKTGTGASVPKDINKSLFSRLGNADSMLDNFLDTWGSIKH